MKKKSGKTIDDMLLLGNPLLYQICSPVLKSDLPMLGQWVNDLDQVMTDIRKAYGFGRGIAAPQLGIMKRLFYINMDHPTVVINPAITQASEELFELWDDCMSFPHLLVRVKRHKEIKMTYRDEHWQPQEWVARDDVSELLQHEFDHLNGILCTMRAIDDKSFKWRK